MNPELAAVEKIFNAFVSCVDQADVGLATFPVPPPLLRDEIAASALFTFEASTNRRAFELAKARGTSVPIAEAPLPFVKVMLADELGVVHLHLHGESDDAAVLRSMSVIVYLNHLHQSGEDHKGWMIMLGVIDYLNGEKIPTSGDVFSIDPRTTGSSNIMRLNGELKLLCHDGVKLSVQSVPEGVRPAQRGEELNPQEEPTPDRIGAFILRDFVTSVSSALEQLYYVNLPRHHVIESTPLHIVKNPERHARHLKHKALRFADRIRYILVEPEKVGEIRPASEQSGEGHHASPTPHQRRGYTKILRAERFKKRRWAVVHVRPTWVGAEEWDFGNVRFRVIAPGAVL